MQLSNIIISKSSPESVGLVRDFLRSHSSGVLATADAAASPHASVVYFSIDDNFCVTFITKTETQKYRDLQQNDQAAFVSYDEANQTSVQISGQVKRVKSERLQEEMLGTVHHLSETRSNSKLPPIEKLLAGEFVLLKLVPQIIKLAIFQRPESGGRDIYETLLFGADTGKDMLSLSEAE